MSASIRWTPTANGKSLHVNAPSAFMEILKRAFGEFPIELDEAALPVLRGIIAAQTTFPEDGFAQLVSAIENHGAIRVWAVY